MGKVWGPDAVWKNVFTTDMSIITALDESPLLEGLLYVGTDEGLVQVSEDGGRTWRKTERFPGARATTFVLVVTDAAGKTVRTLEAPASAGVRRTTWDLRGEKTSVGQTRRIPAPLVAPRAVHGDAREESRRGRDAARSARRTDLRGGGGAGRALNRGRQPRAVYLRCLLTSFVISNMLTEDFPPNTAFSVASALIIRLFFLSWSPCFLM